MAVFKELSSKKLYAITDQKLAGCDHTKIVAAILAGGGKLIQLREKTLSTKEFYKVAIESLALTRQNGACLIINDRVDIAQILGADGVHLGQDDLSPEKARLILGDNAIIGLSTHSLAQALIADKLPIDYIALGPIFPTLTKPEACNGVSTGWVGLNLLKEVCANVSKPVVAIGGITLERARDVINAGASSVAVISDLVKFSNISQRTASFLEHLK